ncbi:MAG TPA: ATP-binding protein [candidate division Zixibacteria bacterium]|nr:ATP-binding protein [candidate division Zixibacteria bacterium]
MARKSADRSKVGEYPKNNKVSPAMPGKASTDTEIIAELQERVTSLTATNRQLKRKIFDLYTIFEISRNFNSVLDYKTLLDTFILTSLAQVGASKAAIFLPQEGHRDRLSMTERRGSGEFPDRRRFFVLGSRLLDYLTRLNRPIATEEIVLKMARKGERHILEKFHPGLIVPLVFQSRLSGVFTISDKLSGRDFEMEDIEFLSVLGSQISVAIENTRLYEAERQATHQLRSAQEQLLTTERLAALGEMSAKVAHEINNPLGIIKNYLQLIRRTVGRNVEAVNYADVVGEEIDRIAGIVRELLDFHRPRGLEFKPTDLAALVTSVLKLMERQIKSRSIEVTRTFPQDCPMVKASPEGLKQVFINIIINACDAMPDGGRLGVEIKAEGKRVELMFCDTGPGIEPEMIPRIFEPFFTTKDPGKGTGLGLSVCYGIIKKHGGSIRYENTSQGGCFTIELPLGGL